MVHKITKRREAARDWKSPMLSRMVLFFTLLPSLPSLVFAATDVVPTYCASYGSGINNATCAQNAINAGIPLVVSGHLKSNTTLVFNSEGTTIEGSGILEANTTINAVGGISGITYRGEMIVSATADVRDVVFDGITWEWGPFRVRPGAQTNGMKISNGVIQNIVAGDSTLTAVFHLHGDGITVENNTFYPTTKDGSAHQGAANVFGGSGSYRIFRFNTFNLKHATQAWRGNAISHSGLYAEFQPFVVVGSSRGNWIYGNTIIDGREENIVFDGPATFNMVKSGYISNLSGSSMTVSGGKGGFSTDYNYPSDGSGFDLYVVTGANPGRTYRLDSGSGNTVNIAETPTMLQNGDFVAIGSFFMHNRIFRNTILGDNVGTGIMLFSGAFGNIIEDNTLDVPNGEFYNAALNGYIQRAGIGTVGLAYNTDEENVELSSTGYAGASYNRILDNIINTNSEQQLNMLPIFNDGTFDGDYHMHDIPGGLPVGYDVGNVIIGNIAENTGVGSGSAISSQVNLVYRGNTLGPDWDNWDYAGTSYYTEINSALPVVRDFAVPMRWDELTVPIFIFTGDDATGITGYMVQESAITPAHDAVGWSATAQESFTFGSTGAKRLWAFVKDGANNVSVGAESYVLVTNSGNSDNPDLSMGSSVIDRDGGTITITAWPDATIYYRWNGTGEYTEYTEPLTITNQTSIQYYAEDEFYTEQQKTLLLTENNLKTPTGSHGGYLKTPSGSPGGVLKTPSGTTL